MSERRTIGLALSGGGSRAIAFHLGCLRALHDRDLLDRVSVLSAVSGGSMIAALWAYSDRSFEAFEEDVIALLSMGLTTGILRQTLASPETLRIALALAMAGIPAALATSLRVLLGSANSAGLIGAMSPATKERLSAPVRRFASRTTAFERLLKTSYFGEQRVDAVARPGLAVVLNAAELRTGTAFRFGSSHSGSWRHGQLVETPSIARAVACSAAFPALLPAMDLELDFEQKEVQSRKRVIVTDGGVYDNLGITPLLPDRSVDVSTNVYPVDFIIACVAGHGVPSGRTRPNLWPSRMLATVNTTHRRTEAQSFRMLHQLAIDGDIEGFLMPYLGQQDSQLPYVPGDFVERSSVNGYPTDFSAMSKTNIAKLSQRGEQLTRLMIEVHAPYLS